MLNRRTGFLLGGVAFFIAGLIFVFLDPQTLTHIINVNLEERVFSGSVPALMFFITLICIWLSFRETKAGALEKGKKSLEEATDRVRSAVDTIEGRLTTVRFIISGPKEIVSELNKLFQERKLKGEYTVRRRAKKLDEGALDFYEDSPGKAIMADVKDVPMGHDVKIEIVAKYGSKQWRASESVRARLVNMELERG